MVWVSVFLPLGSVSVAAGGQAQSEPVDFTKFSLEELKNVQIISASKRPEIVWDAASAVYVITKEQIRRSGATSIPEVLRLAPGVQHGLAIVRHVYARVDALGHGVDQIARVRPVGDVVGEVAAKILQPELAKVATTDNDMGVVLDLRLAFTCGTIGGTSSYGPRHLPAVPGRFDMAGAGGGPKCFLYKYFRLLPSDSIPDSSAVHKNVLDRQHPRPG